MTSPTETLPLPPVANPERAMALALRLAHAENALHALTSGQVDAIVDPDGKAHLLRPAQEQLRESEGRLQTLIDSIADVITVVNRGGIILSQSRALRRVFGYEPDELEGLSLLDLVHTDDLPRTYSAFLNVIEGFQENSAVEFRHLTRDGTYRMVEATVGILRDASCACVVFSLRPITKTLRELAAPARMKPQPGAEDNHPIPSRQLHTKIELL